MTTSAAHRISTTLTDVTFVAGDIELFSALVRKHQWENLGNLPIVHEPDRKTYYDQLVHRLEDQYLLKLVKPENRIFLDTLDRYSGRSDVDIQVTIKDGETVSLTVLIDELLARLLFVHQPDDRRFFRETILREPIRTVVQVLHCAAAVHAGPRREPRFASSQAIDQLLHALSGPLGGLGLQPHHVRGMTTRDIGPLVTATLVDADRLDPGYRLYPEFADSMVNLAIIGLGAKIAGLMAEKPQVAIDCFIKIGLAREIQLSGPASPRERRSFMQGYLRFTGLDRTEHALEVARRASVYLNRDSNNRRSVHRGTIALWGSDMDDGKNMPLFSMYGLDTERGSAISREDVPDILRRFWEIGDAVAMRKLQDDGVGDARNLGVFYHTLESLENLISTPETRGVAMLPIQIATDALGRRQPIISIHNLIALVGHVLDCNSEDEINLLLRRSSQVRLYPLPQAVTAGRGELVSMPDINGGHSNRETEEYPDYLIDSNDKSIISFPFLSEFLNAWGGYWKKKWVEANSDHLPMFAVAAVWTRFYSSLEQYDLVIDERRHAQKGEGRQDRRVYAGEALHRMIVNFLNAALVEQSRYDGRSMLEGLDLRNPVVGDSAFIKNLQAFNTESGLFGMLWSFPIWLFFLDNKSPVYRACFDAASRIPGVDMGDFTVDLQYDQDGLHYGTDSGENLFSFYNALLLRRPAMLSVPHRNTAPGDATSQA